MKKLISIILMIILLLGVGYYTVNAATPCSVSVGPSRTVQVGDSVSITVTFSIPAGSADFTLYYDSSVLQYQSDTVNGAGQKSGSVRVVFLDMDKGTTLKSVTYKFKAKKAGSSRISISVDTLSDTNANRLTANAGSATITVKQESTNTNTNKPVTNTNTNGSGNGSTTDTTKFTSVNQTVYATDTVNIRKEPNSTATILATLAKGKSIKRTGTSTSGWSRVSYNGQTAYISSTFLTTTKPKENEDNKNEEKNEVTNNTVTNEVTNNVVGNETNNTVENNVTNNETVNGTTNETTNNLENNTQNVGQEEKQPNYVLYTIIGIIVLAIIIIIIVSIYENRRSQKNRRK